MGHYNIKPTEPQHIVPLIDNLAPSIINEMSILTSLPVKTVINMTINEAEEAWTVSGKEGILCILGIGKKSFLSDVGYPWILPTIHMSNHTKSFLKGTKPVLDFWLRKYSHLENYVPAAFTEAIRWLKWAGFSISDAEPIGVNKQLVHKVVLTRNKL